ncbi:tannase/feruloyl esterase family alpha/beta hydrolase [Nocardia miyunensis]|uniref:tannase/feruloyl esterase family alpha/beta hydrolase n=1 Tax=Nocardia miyunensis TaxID=282684 RepID=UPI00082F8B40|nr:tannase/feruloyl esterase family alpha/beta hydrolase [Nocardia miyunensis]
MRQRWILRQLSKVLPVLAATTALLIAGAGCSSQNGGSSGGSSTSAPATAPITTLPAGRELPVMLPKTNCADLSGHDFGAIAQAPTGISSATVVAKSAARSFEYCDVKGYVGGQISFELHLPTTTYRGRYLQQGCGGYCGMVDLSSGPPASTGCAPVTDGSLVVGTDDQGHTGTGGAEVWAVDPQLKVDFGYRAEHVFALAAKAITATYYGAMPRFSYYDGCSDGGREALMEAQRYPGDFDGVLAGAPAFNQTALNGFEEAYLSTVDFRSNGSVILPAAKVDVLHAAVIEACADPGSNDRTIQDPRDCKFDPASLNCPAGQDNPNCLTREQVEVARKIYAGVVAPDGTHLYTGGEPIGSEGQWVGLIVPPDGKGRDSTFTYKIGSGFLRWLGHWQADPTASVDASVFTVANLKKFQDEVGGLYDATDPDLSAFATRGGKLIHWHGWSDGYIPTVGSITYRQALIDTMGQTAADKFYRLYLFPGVFHCGNGYGPNKFDLLTPLMEWTEHGRRPGAVIASKYANTGPSNALTGATGTTTSGAPAYQRPVYPYPQHIAYSGSGDVNAAASYIPRTPPPRDDHYKWGGNAFTSGYQQWCAADDGRALSCTRHKP